MAAELVGVVTRSQKNEATNGKVYHNLEIGEIPVNPSEAIKQRMPAVGEQVRALIVHRSGEKDGKRWAMNEVISLEVTSSPNGHA